MTRDDLKATRQIFLKWLSMPGLQHAEATALCLGCDPMHYPRLRNLIERDFGIRFNELEREIARKFPQRDLRDDVPVVPERLFQWALDVELELPEEFLRAGNKLFNEQDGSQKQTADNALEIDAFREENAKLKKEVARLKMENPTPKERRSLLLMIFGMATVGYKWDPKSERSGIPKEIVDDMAHRATAETVLKYLRQSYEEVQEYDSIKR